MPSYRLVKIKKEVVSAPHNPKRDRISITKKQEVKRDRIPQPKMRSLPCVLKVAEGDRVDVQLSQP
jgi:hypothetical protein